MYSSIYMLSISVYLSLQVCHMQEHYQTNQPCGISPSSGLERPPSALAEVFCSCSFRIALADATSLRHDNGHQPPTPCGVHNTGMVLACLTPMAFFKIMRNEHIQKWRAYACVYTCLAHDELGMNTSRNGHNWKAALCSSVTYMPQHECKPDIINTHMQAWDSRFGLCEPCQVTCRCLV